MMTEFTYLLHLYQLKGLNIRYNLTLIKLLQNNLNAVSGCC
jgi:hypothetical protein